MLETSIIKKNHTELLYEKCLHNLFKIWVYCSFTYAMYTSFQITISIISLSLASLTDTYVRPGGLLVRNPPLHSCDRCDHRKHRMNCVNNNTLNTKAHMTVTIEQLAGRWTARLVATACHQDQEIRSSMIVVVVVAAAIVVRALPLTLPRLLNTLLIGMVMALTFHISPHTRHLCLSLISLSLPLSLVHPSLRYC